MSRPVGRETAPRGWLPLATVGTCRLTCTDTTRDRWRPLAVLGRLADCLRTEKGGTGTASPSLKRCPYVAVSCRKPQRSTCHGLSFIALRAPVPFGVTTNFEQITANRAEPVVCGRNGSGEASTAAFGPALMTDSRHG
jgi:hypothetical protein